jgi:hypothetical protein
MIGNGQGGKATGVATPAWEKLGGKAMGVSKVGADPTVGIAPCWPSPVARPELV